MALSIGTRFMTNPQESQLDNRRGFRISKYFARGESLVATTGMAFVAILAFAVGGVVWVSARTIEDSVFTQAEEQVRGTSSLIASQSELRLSDRDLSGLRRLVLDAVASGMVEECEVSLAGYGLLASSSSAPTLIEELPDTWTTTPEVHASLVHNKKLGKTTIHEPLMLDGQGGILLKLVVDQSGRVIGSDTVRASSVGISSVGLVLMLFVYRRFRNRLGALAGIREALYAAQEGERRVECLRVGDRLGSEAEIWNTLLGERFELEQQLVNNEIVESFGSGMAESIGLPAACNTLNQGMMLVESDLRVAYTNGAACVFLRTTQPKIIDKSLETLEGAEEIIAAVRSVLEKTGLPRQVLEVGEVGEIESAGAILRVVISRVEEEHMPQAMIFIEDVTQQRLADQSQSDFIAQATHELRTPLTTIRLYTEEAVEAGSDDEQTLEKALNVINSESRRLERIVGDMLCVSEIEAGSLSVRPDNMRTDQLFDDLQSDYDAQAKEKSIELVFTLPPKFPAIHADRDRLGQALHNLIGNAIKYTPSGGRVEVKAHFSENNSVAVDVIDSGIGIDESQQERIFDRFCRADDRRIAKVTGSGLGLALARQIARLHGGDVTVESEIDKGSTFTLTIPGTEAKAQAA
jgi:signal transduction histidine kinase